jgi:hypothetical protein
MDWEIEIHIVPLDNGFEAHPEKAIVRSVTCVSDLDNLMHQGQKFLNSLPEADNHTSWS